MTRNATSECASQTDTPCSADAKAGCCVASSLSWFAGSATNFAAINVFFHRLVQIASLRLQCAECMPQSWRHPSYSNHTVWQSLDSYKHTQTHTRINTTILALSAGSARKGATTLCLPCLHPSRSTTAANWRQTRHAM